MQIRDGRVLMDTTKHASGTRIVRDGAPSVYGLLRHLSPGLMFDVGAAAGYTTRLMLENSPESEVVAFEPFTGNHKFFMKTIGDDSRVTLIKKAVADRSGTGLFQTGAVVQGVESGWKHLQGYSSLGYLLEMEGTEASSAEPPNSGVIHIPTVTIDEVVERGQVRFMKVDVQGGELGVLRGGSRMLTDGRIDLMYLEFSGDEALLDYLSSFSLTVFDSEYMLIPMNSGVDLSDWSLSEDVNLSTGWKAHKAFPKDRPVESEMYVQFLAEQTEKIGHVWTDLIVVNDELLPSLLQLSERI